MTTACYRVRDTDWELTLMCANSYQINDQGVDHQQELEMVVEDLGAFVDFWNEVKGGEEVWSCELAALNAHIVDFDETNVQTSMELRYPVRS